MTKITKDKIAKFEENIKFYKVRYDAFRRDYYSRNGRQIATVLIID